MQEIHAKVFDILYNEHLKDESFRFSLRRSNRFGRLTKGYWFHGNDDYLAVSFWSGMDWKNKTPNIYFVIYSNGSSKLEISVTDSAKKQSFINDAILPVMRDRYKMIMMPNWKKNHHNYRNKDYQTSLIDFLTNEKKVIDQIIRRGYEFQPKDFSPEYYDDETGMYDVETFDEISFISPFTFSQNLKNILKYKARKGNVAEKIEIRKIEIKLFGDVREKLTMNVPEGTNWIFLTGENGAGKSTILKALTLGLLRNIPERYARHETGHFEIDVTVNFKNDKKLSRVHSSYASKTPNQKSNRPPFAAYGASRLITIENSDDDKAALHYSIFRSDGLLLDLASHLPEITSDPKTGKGRLELIVDLLTDKELIPQLAFIQFPDGKNFSETRYIEKSAEDEHYQSVEFDQLASGVRSMVAFLGDMLIRLFRQQPNVIDPSELSGIVLIDEIDIHLHPKMQKRIVEILSANFPNIQFVATTHSPITLLGAPTNSKIFKVFRKVDKGVCVDPLDSVDFKNLLPNALLTSPIFDLSIIRPFGNVDVTALNFDNAYDETMFYKLVRAQIEKLSNTEQSDDSSEKKS